MWMTNHMRNVQEVLEQIALEQLMNTLPQEVNIWVKDRKPKTAIEAGQLADEYILVRQQAGEPRHCGQQHNERLHGHERIQCYYSNKQGHIARECRRPNLIRLKRGS